MNRPGAFVALAVLLGWGVFQSLGLAPLSPPLQAWLGLVGGMGAVALMRHGVVVRGLMALLAPFGVALPALALAGMAGAWGVALPPVSTVELAVFLLGYTLFLAGAFGLLPLDLYRLGYVPLPVGAMVVVLCLYGAVSGQWPVAIVAILGQLFWALNWGSSNWFDHVLHVLLWPIALITLILRLL